MTKRRRWHNGILPRRGQRLRVWLFLVWALASVACLTLSRAFEQQPPEQHQQQQDGPRRSPPQLPACLAHYHPNDIATEWNETLLDLLAPFRRSQTKVDASEEEAGVCLNVIAPSTSVGLSMDLDAYRQSTTSHDKNGSSLLSIRAENIAKFDPTRNNNTAQIDLFLEHPPRPDGVWYYKPHAIMGKMFAYSERGGVWLAVNPEWIKASHLQQLDPPVRVVIAKTRVTRDALVRYRHAHGLNYPVIYTKHTSHDVYRPNITKTFDAFLHVAGQSHNKNTEAILQAWGQHPEWPKLVLVTKESHFRRMLQRYQREHPSMAQNVELRYGKLPREELVTLQNRIGFHLCPSVVEGYGHYLNEARSTGAVILTTHLPPMSELVDAAAGVWIATTNQTTFGALQVPGGTVSPTDVSRGVQQLLALSVAERRAMGHRARRAFERDTAFFQCALSTLTAALCGGPLPLSALAPFVF